MYTSYLEAHARTRDERQFNDMNREIFSSKIGLTNLYNTSPAAIIKGHGSKLTADDCEYNGYLQGKLDQNPCSR